MEERNSEAYHEAAHAFVGWYYGLKILAVTIEGPIKEEAVMNRTGTPCYCDFSGVPLASFFRFTSENLFIRLKLKLAGSIIEKKMEGKISDGGLIDIYKTMRLLYWQDPEMQTLAEDARMIITENSDDWKTSAMLFYKKHCGFMEDFLADPKKEAAIETVASELVKRGRISGFDAACLFEKSWGYPLPEKARPAREHPTLNEKTTPENGFAHAFGLVKTALRVLRNYDENEKFERAIKAVMNCFFVLCEISDDILGEGSIDKLMGD